MLKSIAKHYHEQIYNFTQFMFFTGMRTSEGISLRRGHVDFHHKEVLVELVNVYDEESDSTKTSVSRKVKLNSLALEALQRQKAHTFLAGDFIFHNPKTNEPWAYRRITDVRGHWEVTLSPLNNPIPPMLAGPDASKAVAEFARTWNISIQFLANIVEVSV
ncbi:tyrosine-type recombinase/integrase, partial [Collimonas sp.]|uniref:tyrosine-type recombinase/integrase n=1 Tax=Collimonas sp. TaxID=1963772 RepID=UPI0037C10D21